MEQTKELNSNENARRSTSLSCLFGCGEVVEIQEMKDHLMSCPNRKVKCPNSGCDERIAVKHVSDHLISCGKAELDESAEGKIQKVTGREEVNEIRRRTPPLPDSCDSSESTEEVDESSMSLSSDEEDSYEEDTDDSERSESGSDVDEDESNEEDDDGSPWNDLSVEGTSLMSSKCENGYALENASNSQNSPSFVRLYLRSRYHQAGFLIFISATTVLLLALGLVSVLKQPISIPQMNIAEPPPTLKIEKESRLLCGSPLPNKIMISNCSTTELSGWVHTHNYNKTSFHHFGDRFLTYLTKDKEKALIVASGGKLFNVYSNYIDLNRYLLLGEWVADVEYLDWNNQVRRLSVSEMIPKGFSVYHLDWNGIPTRSTLQL